MGHVLAGDSASDDQHVELAVEVFAMLADVTRVRLILALCEHQELSVNQLAELVNRAAPAVSQHLAKLRMARMVTTRQDGTRVHYRLVDEHAMQLVHAAILQAEHAVDPAPRHHQQS